MVILLYPITLVKGTTCSSPQNVLIKDQHVFFFLLMLFSLTRPAAVPVAQRYYICLSRTKGSDANL